MRRRRGHDRHRVDDRDWAHAAARGEHPDGGVCERGRRILVEPDVEEQAAAGASATCAARSPCTVAEVANSASGRCSGGHVGCSVDGSDTRPHLQLLRLAGGQQPVGERCLDLRLADDVDRRRQSPRSGRRGPGRASRAVASPRRSRPPGRAARTARYRDRRRSRAGAAARPRRSGPRAARGRRCAVRRSRGRAGGLR